jgi:hypothetical protein
VKASSGRPAVLEHLPWRIAGLLSLGALVVVYQPEHADTVNRLLIPVGMAVATWLLVQNVTAVALGAGLLAAIHGDLGSSDWIRGVAYPLLASACGLVVAMAFVQRFRRRIAATHEERWRRRRNRRQDEA